MLGGAYASFAEIAIKRSVTRDGLSNYFLNNARCRRKDIIDVFLGTGLGARGSYSVIEQGMISRVIEAKPDELRGFLEEAAGISKYRERRRETETRIRHTNENLARVNDVREELDKQLGHLQRQAKAAERYQELKADERRYESELLALRWREIDAKRAYQRQLLHERATTVEAALSELRRIEMQQSELRVEQTRALDAFNLTQSDYYAKSAEISRLEQAIQHQIERRHNLEAELNRARFNLDETVRLADEDAAKQTRLATDLGALSPLHDEHAITEEECTKRLRLAEESAANWQLNWDTFNREQAEVARLEHAENVRFEMLQAGLVDAQRRMAILAAERAELETSNLETRVATAITELNDKSRTYEDIVAALGETRTTLVNARAEIQTHGRTLHKLNSELQQVLGRQAALSALQKAALGQEGEQRLKWLERHHLSAAPVLAQTLSIDPGWEMAVEIALKLSLSTLCEPGLVARLLAFEPNELPGSRLAVIEQKAPPPIPAQSGVPRLVDKVRCAWPIESLLAGVYVAADLAAALAMKPRLKSFESVITRDGVWMGPNWIQFPERAGDENGILLRQRALDELVCHGKETRAAIARAEALLHEQSISAAALEDRDLNLNAQLQAAYAAAAECKNQLVLHSATRERTQARATAISQEIAELDHQTRQTETTLLSLRDRHASLRAHLSELAARGAALSEARRAMQTEVDDARHAWRSARDSLHAIALKLESLRSTHASIAVALGRNSRLTEPLTERTADLAAQIEATAAPSRDLKLPLEQALS
ncbi:MAG: hypothetical protein ACREXT_13185, partial [Gammaproteobacteria bacterium]